MVEKKNKKEHTFIKIYGFSECFATICIAYV